jgi:hypothetical protein
MINSDDDDGDDGDDDGDDDDDDLQVLYIGYNLQIWQHDNQLVRLQHELVIVNDLFHADSLSPLGAV